MVTLATSNHSRGGMLSDTYTERNALYMEKLWNSDIHYVLRKGTLEASWKTAFGNATFIFKDKLITELMLCV